MRVRPTLPYSYCAGGCPCERDRPFPTATVHDQPFPTATAGGCPCECDQPFPTATAGGCPYERDRPFPTATAGGCLYSATDPSLQLLQADARASATDPSLQLLRRRMPVQARPTFPYQVGARMSATNLSVVTNSVRVPPLVAQPLHLSHTSL